jgi:hypothetical protein
LAPFASVLATIFLAAFAIVVLLLAVLFGYVALGVALIAASRCAPGHCRGDALALTSVAAQA